jgi:hypothetical protein
VVIFEWDGFDDAGVLERRIVSNPNDTLWYVMRDGQRFGPFNADAFARFEEEGRFRATDRIWRTGNDTWISYNEYGARGVAARLVAPDPPASYKRERYTACRWARKSAQALARALISAFSSILMHRAMTRGGSGTPVGVDNSAAPVAPAPAIDGTAPASADPSLASLHPSLVRLDDQPHDSDPILQQHTADPIRHDRDKDQAGGAHFSMQEDAGPLQYAPRLVNEAQAVAQIGLELITFRAWVADGRLPRALPDCDKYDLKAIHLALDRMSGITSQWNGSHHWLGKLARVQS